jgi:hypothetical protein
MEMHPQMSNLQEEIGVKAMQASVKHDNLCH